MEKKGAELQGHGETLASEQVEEANNESTNTQPEGKLKQIPLLPTCDPHPEVDPGSASTKSICLMAPCWLTQATRRRPTQNGEEEKPKTTQ